MGRSPLDRTVQRPVPMAQSSSYAAHVEGFQYGARRREPRPPTGLAVSAAQDAGPRPTRRCAIEMSYYRTFPGIEAVVRSR